MEYLVYIIIGLYVWEVYLEMHWYLLWDSIKTTPVRKAILFKRKVVQWIKSRL
jgi:hypothetical protein